MNRRTFLARRGVRDYSGDGRHSFQSVVATQDALADAVGRRLDPSFGARDFRRVSRSGRVRARDHRLPARDGGGMTPAALLLLYGLIGLFSGVCVGIIVWRLGSP